MEKFIVNQTKVNEDVKQVHRNQQSMIQNLERIDGKMAQELTKRLPGELPPNTQENLKGDAAQKIHINAVTVSEKKVSGFKERTESDSKSFV